MVLVGGPGLRAVEPEGVGGGGAVVGVGLVGVVLEQAGIGQRVDVGGRVGGRGKRRLAVRVGGFRVGGEIVIEGDVFLEDDDQVLDGRRGRGRGSGGAVHGDSKGDRADAGQRGMANLSNHGKGSRLERVSPAALLAAQHVIGVKPR